MTGSPELTFRRANDDDCEWAAQLMASSEPWLTLGRGIEPCRAACRQSESELFVAQRSAGRCGFIRLQRRGVAGSPYVATIGVAVDQRGHGVGTALLRFAEDRYRPDHRHIFLCVSSFNTRAQALYQRLGYQQVGELNDYVIDGASELLMHKRL
jgi:ribosomal protein S18 acetylase RimI-like enzyme